MSLLERDAQLPRLETALEEARQGMGATGWSLLVTACLLWPGLGTADPDASLPAGFEGRRLQFGLLVLAAVVAACTVFHFASRRPSS
jgi:hypothetical protein